MKIIPTQLEDVLIIAPQVFTDRRGYFMEYFNKARYAAHGIDAAFVQDNLSVSVRHTLRGLHYQHPRGQAKLVQVLEGEVFDVVLDIRRGSPSFGRWIGVRLSHKNYRQLYIPQGFAHGFCVLSKTALFAYKCSDYYAPQDEGGICWNDPDVGIDWPVTRPLLSQRDAVLPKLKAIDAARLPLF